MNFTNSINTIITLVLVTMLASCDLIQFKQKAEEEVEGESAIARVHDKYLYPEDVEGVITEGMSAEDSAHRVNRFVNSWIKKQLLIQEASTIIEFDEAEIERKILDYRYSLMGYEYQQFYVSQNLDTAVTEEEINQYYEENIDNFVLKKNIIRGKFIKVPLSAPRVNEVRRLLYSTREDRVEELNEYCLRFATQYHLVDTVWLNFEDIIKTTPLQEIPNKVQFLKNNRYVDTSDDLFRYFLKIDEYRISDNISPLEFVREDIKNIILNKRKVDLAKKLEEDVYKSASKNNEFEIYN